MSLELLNQLEAKVHTALEALEIMTLELEELRQENTELKSEKQTWEERLSQLLGKFSQLDDSLNDE